MEIDPHAARLLRMLGAGARQDVGRIGIEERRRSFDGLTRFAGQAPSMIMSGRTLPGPGGPLDLRFYRPESADGQPCAALVYFHGGGLVAGSLDGYDVLMRILAHEARCVMIGVDYRLAPEHPCPAAIEDALAAIRHVFDHAASLGIDSDRIAIGGDSGGGTLTAVATQRLRGEPTYQARCQLLLCPVLDFAADWPSRSSFAQGYLLDRGLMERDLEDYAPHRSRHDPLISPLQAVDLSGLPAALIHTAGFDPLRDEGEAYARRLEAEGTRVHHTCHDSMVHHFYGLAGMIPAARAILAHVGAELSRSLERDPVKA